MVIVFAASKMNKMNKITQLAALSLRAGYFIHIYNTWLNFVYPHTEKKVMAWIFPSMDMYALTGKIHFLIY
jgi:hypothetical protein